MRARMACTSLVLSLFVAGGAHAEKKEQPAAALRVKTRTKAVAVSVTGTVRDAQGVPVPGANILVKGTKSGTVTDAKGTFKLEVPKGDEVLVISSVGFKTKEVPLAGQAVLNVQLDDDVASINEVVVVGYGTQKKISLTGAVATVDMKNIQDLPVGSLSAALVSQLPGVGVSGGTSRPGDNAQITVRNPIILSKDGGTLRPLYVIDNVVRTEEDFNLLDVSEVEAISVLKDAAAAIYGARSNQGVVVVQTKRGKVGAPKISYSASYGTSDAAMLPKMMNGYQLATYTNDYNFAGGKSATDASIYTQDELDYFKANNTDWLKMAWKPSSVTRHALNVSGGTERATYFAGISYNKQDANFDNIDANKWTFRASADVKVAKGLKAGMTIAGDLYNKKMYFLKQGSENPEKDMQSLLYTAQFKPAYVDGLPVLTTASTGSSNENFHFFEVQRSGNYTTTRNTGLNVNLTLDYEIPFVKGLRARLLYNKTMDNSFGKQYGTKYNVYQMNMTGTNKHIYGGGVKSIVSLNNGDRVRINPSYTDAYQFNGYLNYDRQFGRHTISAIAFFEQSENSSDGTAAMIESIIAGGLDNMGFGTGTNTVTETQSEAGTLSYAGRLNYNYANKYLLEFAIRRDASTNFAPDKRWGTFPSLSAGWVISEEPFFRSRVRFIDMLKIRASVGMLGGDATKAYNWLSSYSVAQTGKGAVFGGNLDRSIVFSTKNAMANPDARWDDNTKFNVGLDAQLLNNRLSVGLDAFYDHRYNMLTALSSSVPLVIGATLPSENFASVDGFGTELSLGWTNRITKDWSYRINGFLSWSDNKQLKVDADKGFLGTYRDPNGQSTDQGVLGYRYAGMLRTQADLDALLAKYPNYTIEGTAPKLGMLYYQDVRGLKVINPDGSITYGAPDGKITEEDKEWLTKKKDNHYGLGLNFSTTYKRLSFSFTMGGSFGGQAMVESVARGWNTSAQVNAITNLPAFLTDHWTPENPNGMYGSPYYRGQNQLDSDFWFRNSFQLSVRNANLSYDLSPDLVKRLGLTNARVFLVATNPLNLYNPYDYKTYSGSFDAYPVLRSFSAGLNIGL
ncbi:SusC/RagA family TonB-linked outer membrane protein [Arsenicibacter rosenii]|nr:TonB-dependent receptor [Arsenicibacter rosenii]